MAKDQSALHKAFQDVLFELQPSDAQPTAFLEAHVEKSEVESLYVRAVELSPRDASSYTGVLLVC